MFDLIPNEAPDKKAAEQGFRMPAEWEAQKAVWFTWPCNPETWKGRHHKLHAAMAEMIAVVCKYEDVNIICEKSHQHTAERTLRHSECDLSRTSFFDIASDDAWCRDHGPSFIVNEDGESAVVDWKYNGWGSKYPHTRDDAIPKTLSHLLLMQRFRSDITCEGGAVEINTKGHLLTTESVLLNSNRNPDKDRATIEEELKNCLGASNITWLPGGLANDDTDGHIDMCCRFYSDNGIALCVPESNAPDYKTLSQNREIIEGLRTPTGGRYDVAILPYPDPIALEGSDHPACASYLNFLIINDAVIAPIYGHGKKDTEAIGLLSELFTGREIIGIDSCEFVREGGAIHCLSQQQPSV